MDEEMVSDIDETLPTDPCNMAEELYESIKKGDYEAVNSLLSAGVNINTSLDEDLMTPLHYSAKVGNLELYKFLRTKKANLFKRDKRKDTVMNYAVKHNQAEIICEILKEDISYRLVQDFGENIGLVDALKCGNPKIIKMLWEKCSSFTKVCASVPILPSIKKLDKDLQKELLDIMMQKHPKCSFQEMCKFAEQENCPDYETYIDALFNSLVQDEKEKWLVFYCKKGSTAAVKKLIVKNSDYSKICLNEALCNSLENEYLDIVQLLVSCDVEYNEDILVKCIEYGNLGLLKVFVEKMSVYVMPQKNVVNESLQFNDIISIALGKNCQRLLYVAIEVRSVEMLRYLFTLGINFKLPSYHEHGLSFYSHSVKEHEHPLVVAVNSEVLEIVELILEKGVQCEEQYKEELVMKVIKQQNIEMMKLLLKGFPTNTLKRCVFAIAAVETKNVDFIEKLIEVGLDISLGPVSLQTFHIKYAKIKSPLATAVRTGNLELVELCCRHKCYMSKYGQEINLAIKENNGEIVSKLLNYNGREIFENILKDKNVDWTPVHETVQCQNETVLYKLLSYPYIRENIIELIYINSEVNVLQMAVTKKNIKLLIPLIDLSPHRYPEVDLLKHVVKIQYVDAVSLLLERGFPITLETFLMLCHTTKKEIWQKLINEMIHCELSNVDKALMFHEACVANNTELVKLLIKNNIKPGSLRDTNQTVLHVAVANENVEMLKECLQLETTDINTVYERVRSSYHYHHDSTEKPLRYSGTAFHIACEINSLEMAHLLVNYKADVNIGTRTGTFPIDAVLEHSNNDLLEIMYKAGCNFTSNLPGDSPLHVATKHKNLKGIEILVKYGASVYVVNKKGESPVFHLVGDRCEEYDPIIVEQILQFYIDKNADFKLKNSDGDSLLSKAIKSDDMVLTTKLLELGTAINIKAQMQKLPITHLIKRCESKVLQQCIELGFVIPPHNVSLQWLFQRYQIRADLTEEELEMVKILLQAGADVNVRNGEGYTLLHYYVKRNSKTVVKLLIDFNCDVNMKVTEGWSLYENFTALEIAVEKEYFMIAKLLIDAGIIFDGCTILKNIAQGIKSKSVINDEEERRALSDSVETILRSDIDINKAYVDGNTLLHTATVNNNVEFVEKLVSKNCDVNMKVTPGNWSLYENFTALEIAVEKENFMIAKLLIDAGIKFDRCTILKNIAKGIKSKSDRNDEKERRALSDIVETILRSDIDINKAYVDGNTLLHTATVSNDIEFVEKLVSKKCKLDLISNEDAHCSGYTALQIACKQRYMNIVYLLIDNGADTSVVTKAGETILHLLQQSKQQIYTSRYLRGLSSPIKQNEDMVHDNFIFGNQPHKVINVLENMEHYETFIDSINNDGLTALHLAVICNNIDTVKYLVSKQCNLDIITSSSYMNFPSCTAISIALKKGNLRIAKLLLDNNCSINLRDKKQKTLLHDITRTCLDYIQLRDDDITGITLLENKELRGKIVMQLIQQGVPLNTKDENDTTPLLNAIQNQDEELAMLLLQYACPINTKVSTQPSFDYKCSSLMQASKMHMCGIVKVLLASGIQVCERDDEQRTALHYMCRSHPVWRNSRQCTTDCLQVIERLSGRIPINDKDKYGDTPLHIACFSENYDAVKLLLSNPSLSLHKEEATSIIKKCISEMRSENSSKLELVIEALLLRQQVDITQDMLFKAVEECSASFVTLLLNYGANPDLTDTNGNSLVHICISRREKKEYLVSKLFYYKANFNLQNNKGQTPLYIACSNGNFDAVNLLLYFGARLDIPDNNGWTCFHLIMERHVDKELVNIIFQQEGNINSKTTKYVKGHSEGMTPIMILLSQKSTKEENFYKIQKLTEKGADLNAVNSSGDHSLLVALKSNPKENVLNYLLENSACVNLQNNQGFSPLHIAVQHSQNNIVELLIKYNCNMNSQTKVQHGAETPLMLAIKKVDIPVVKLLLEYGSSLFIKDASNVNPVDLCVKLKEVPSKKILEMLVMIVKAGGNVKHISDAKFVKVLTQSEELVDLLVQSGCRIKFEESLSSDGEQAIVSKLMEKQQQPLSLLRIAANTVRINFRPNALFSVEKLPIPNRMKSVIVFKNTVINMENVKDYTTDLLFSMFERNLLTQVLLARMGMNQMGMNPFGFPTILDSGMYYHSDDDSDDHYVSDDDYDYDDYFYS